MFRMIGFGEHAGSGVPLIYGNWQQQMYRLPEITESFQPEMITLTLNMVSLLPDEVMKALTEMYGPVISSLSNEQKIALAIAYTDGEVTHSRIMGLSSIHSHDLTRDLRELVDMRLLSPYRETRGRFYRLFQPATPETAGTLSAFGPAEKEGQPAISSEHLVPSSDHLGASSDNLVPSSDHLPSSSEHSEIQHLVDQQIRGRKKIPLSELQELILIVCSRRDFVSLRDLAHTLHRSHYRIRSPLASLIRDGRIELQYPEAPNHPRQGYRTKTNSDEPLS